LGYTGEKNSRLNDGGQGPGTRGGETYVGRLPGNSVKWVKGKDEVGLKTNNQYGERERPRGSEDVEVPAW